MIMPEMYFDKKDFPKKFCPLYGGLNIRPLHTDVNINLSGNNDNVLGFYNNAGLPVYVSNNSILMQDKNFYQIRVKPDKDIENSSEFNVHKNGVSMFRLKEGKRLEEISLKAKENQSFIFVGLSSK